MKIKIVCLSALISMVFFACAPKPVNTTTPPEAIQKPTDTENRSFYNHKVSDIYGDAYNMDQLRGKKVMVVITASECGLTPQFTELQDLYNKYGETGFEILGFPTSSFEDLEPLDNEEIAAFCEKNYGVTFPMMDKTEVIGANQHPLFEWLTQKELNKKMDTEITYTFYKFLINKDGSLAAVHTPETKPSDKKIIHWLKSE